MIVARWILLNLALFIGIAVNIDDFDIHHHWILPGVMAVVWLQLLTARNKLKGAALSLSIKTLLSIATVFMVIGAIRFETIFACFDRCNFKLSGMYFLGAAAFFAASVWEKKSYKKFGFLFAGLALVPMIVEFYFE